MKGLGPIFLILVLIISIYLEVQRPTYPPKKDSCYSCHQFAISTDKNHPFDAMGCSLCHLGNPYALQKEAAHMGIVRNPGELAFAKETCGRGGCHPEQVQRVENSIMATNAGILHRMRIVWERMGFEGSFWPRTVESSFQRQREEPPFLDYFRKMCGSCHLHKEFGDVVGEIGERGGGCSACHVIREREGKIGKGEGFGVKAPYNHREITTRIPSLNCIRCHNRSARIGLSYRGQYESEGYGTPYEGDGFSSRRLPGKRYYLELLPDIHHRKSGLDCIDCHNGQEVMGDGKRYGLLKEQVDTSCLSCHAQNHWEDGPKEGPIGDLGLKLVSLNGKLQVKEGEIIRYSPKGYPLYNVVSTQKGLFLFRKSDGQPFEISSIKKEPYHHLRGHERLSCLACHSQWMPQCYGCHIAQREGLQWDWIRKEGSMPQWFERRDFMRFESPPLGLRDGKVYPISAHYVSFYDGVEGSRSRHDYFGLASFDPHTTQKRSRTCFECHGDPKTYGLSYLYPGMDLLTGKEGIDVKSFEMADIQRILRVGECIGCHGDYADKIYGDFSQSYNRFLWDTELPCRR